MSAIYTQAPYGYSRLQTLEVKIGDLVLGNGHPIRVQTMTTTNTLDTEATVQQAIRCINAGAELVRITAPSKTEAENLAVIKKELNARGYHIPLVADIHYTPNAAEIAARIVEKVRINPGNYADKKRFDIEEYSDAEYAAEIDRIRDRFLPLVRICKDQGTAMRIGTNHGSLSDRIMSRYGDSPAGMVESAMEFLRIARNENYHNIVLSMKSSNPLVMIAAYRLLVVHMHDEFGVCYPLHLGVTEAGDGEDGRIKSAIGIGSLLEDGLGDTIRVSLTEDPEFELPVGKDLVARYNSRGIVATPNLLPLPFHSFQYARRETIHHRLPIGSGHVPVVVADLSQQPLTSPAVLESIGYTYQPDTDKWNIADTAADYIYTGDYLPGFALPSSLVMLSNQTAAIPGALPVLSWQQFRNHPRGAGTDPIFIWAQCADLEADNTWMEQLQRCENGILVCSGAGEMPMKQLRYRFAQAKAAGLKIPVIIRAHSSAATVDEQLIDFSTQLGTLCSDGLGDGIWLTHDATKLNNIRVSGRTYLEVKQPLQFLNNTAFSILQAARTRISKTEYISCPSCGRTLFDLQETTARIREATHHLKGVKIAIMGCIVNGPGEMADADFGYVGSGPGKITLYKGKEVIRKNIPTDTAVDELIRLLRDSGVWINRQ